MKCKILLLSCVLLAGCADKAEYTAEDNEYARFVKVGEGFAKTSVNTSIFRQSPLVSDSARQFVSFYDEQGMMVIAKRRRGEACWTLLKTPYKGNTRDAHRGISLGLDGAGTLHVAFDHHVSPMNYLCVDTAAAMTLGERVAMTGMAEERVTYPEFYTMPDGDLIFAYRSGTSGRGNMLLNRYSVENKRWTQLHENLVDGQDQRNAYWQLYVDNRGAIHLSWVWRETGDVATNHDLCYARSLDGGVSWERSDGTPYDLPITMETAEVAWEIPQNSDLINQTSMTADFDGHPYIATYWRDAQSDVPQYRLVWHDGSEWKMSVVGHRTTPFSLSGRGTKMIPVSRPRVISDGEKAFYFFRDEERGSVVSMATTATLDSIQWEICDITDFSVDAWEPTIDMTLWNREKKINLFVQRTHQGDGEKLSRNREKKSPVYILEIK